MQLTGVIFAGMCRYWSLPGCRLRAACTCRSFGVLLWEMLSGRRAWAGLAYVRVVQAVAIDGKSPQFPDSAPADYAVSKVRQCRTMGVLASCTAMHLVLCSQRTTVSAVSSA